MERLLGATLGPVGREASMSAEEADPGSFLKHLFIDLFFKDLFYSHEREREKERKRKKDLSPPS